MGGFFGVAAKEKSIRDTNEKQKKGMTFGVEI